MTKELYNFNEVVLVDSNDQDLGTMDKMEAHEKGLLHRAFSVFLFNDKGQMLIQKRANTKYHSADLWSNACCSHPAKNEDILAAAKRRLFEEIYIKSDLTPLFHFMYKADLNSNLVEHELDHVLIGFCNEFNQLNTEEVSEMKFVDLEELKSDLKQNPNQYTEWFKIILNNHWNHFEPHLNLITT